MNAQHDTVLRDWPHLVQVMPNSSHLALADDLIEKSKTVTDGATTAGHIWYGTYRPGIRVEKGSRESYFLESPTVGAWSAFAEFSETNLFSGFRKTIFEIKALIRSGDIGGARRLLGALPGDKLASRIVCDLSLLLSRPSGRVLEKGTGRLPNLKWLASNRGSFAGQWVALENNSLVESDASLKSLRECIRSSRDSLRGIQFVRMAD